MATTQNPESSSSNLPVPSIGSNMPVAAGETSSSAIAARERASVEARFLVALHRPRVFERAYARLMTACKRPAFAEAARYAKPVGGKDVHGLSIRFAEEAANLWGNIDVTTFLVFDDDERRIYRTTATDLETNATHSVDIMVEKFVERRSPKQGQEVVGQRQNSSGQVVYKIRATEDDLIVKVNNYIAKARRNVILPLIPADVREDCEQQIIATVANRDAVDPEGAKKRLALLFHAMGVDVESIEKLLGHPLGAVTPAELTLLRSYYTSLKDGESTWADIMEAHGGATGGSGKPAAAAKGADGLKSTLAGQKSAATAPATAPKPAPKLAENCTKKCKVEDGQVIHHDICPNYSDPD